MKECTKNALANEQTMDDCKNQRCLHKEIHNK